MTAPAPTSRSTFQTAAILLAGAAILFLRRPDQFTNPQLWAEDGIFFFQARTQGLEAFTLELAGYFHLAPRLIAALAAALDPALVPHIFVGSAFALTLYVMSRVLSPRCPLPFRPACALALVLVPEASEVLLNVNNLQWVFVPGWIVLLVSAEPLRPAQRAHDTAAALLFGLTSPFSLVMTPFFAWRAFTRRTRFSALLLALVSLSALLQAVSILRHPQPLPANATFDPAAAFAFPGLRVLGSLFLSPWLSHPPPFALSVTLTLALLLALLALTFRRPLPPSSFSTLHLTLTLAFLASLASTLYRCWHSMPVLCVPHAATRYVFPLQVLFLWLILLRAHDSSRAVRLVFLSLAALAIALNFSRLRIAPLPDKHWTRYAPQLRAGEAVTVPINPDGWEFPFPARPPR